MMSQGLGLITCGADETMEVGRAVGVDLVPGDVLALTGDLGSGKTCLVQGISRGMQVPDKSCVRSSTFVILNMFEGRYPLYHMDLYRVQDPAELEDIGYREIFFGDGITVIEWAEKIERFLPEAHLRVHLNFLDESRREIFLEPVGRHFEERLRAWGTSLTRFARPVQHSTR